MNRTERLYALVEQLRAVSPRTRSAAWLARRFEVSPRTVERDLGALRQSGVPIWSESGRAGGYGLDRDRLLWGPSGWYLLAWCRLREGVRGFRLDRIRSARLRDERLPGRDHADLRRELARLDVRPLLEM